MVGTSTEVRISPRKGETWVAYWSADRIPGPGIEDLDRLGPGPLLHLHILDGRRGEDHHELPDGVGVRGEEPAHRGEVPFVLALDQVAREREGGRGEPEDGPVGPFPQAPDRLPDESRLALGIQGGAKAREVLAVAHRVRDARPLARIQVHLRAQALEGMDDVRKDDGRVEIEELEGFHGQLRGEVRVLGQFEDAMGLPHLAVPG